MSIAEQIQRIEDNIKASYTALADKGVTMPTNKNSDNLATTIENLEVGGGSSENDEVLKGIVEVTATDIVLPDNVEKIAKYFFYKSTNYPFSNGITSIKANGVKEVEKNAVANNRETLTEINLPNLEVVGDTALASGAGGFSQTCLVKKIKLGKLKSVGTSGFSGIFNPASGITQEIEMSFDNCVISTNAFKYYNAPSFDGTGIKSIGTCPFYYCGNNIKKLWLPSTIETISASNTTNGQLFRFDNAGPKTAVTIYTDVADENSIPSGWGVGWNSPSTYVTTVYGVTYEDFLNAEV